MPTQHTMTSLAIACASVAAFVAASIASPCASAQTQPQMQAMAQSATVNARATTPPADVSAAQELADLQAQIPILEAKARIAKLKAEIDNGGNAPSAPSNAALSAMPSWSMNAPHATSPSEAASSPASAHAGMQAVSISGFDGRYQAVLTIDGRNVSVRPGDTLDGGWKVSNITESSVTLARGKQVVVLRV